VHHRAVDLTGQRLNYLTAVSYAGSDGKKSIWNIRCDCGKVFQMPASEFKKGEQKSCGCKRGELISKALSTHGMSKHPAFSVWRSMIDRCGLKSHQSWHNYGGRGILVCASWVKSFENFWRDMGPTYQPGLTLERIDADAGYSLENCRWATYLEQARNRRTNRWVNTPWGRITVSEASEISGIRQNTLLYRVHHGCPENLLFTKPDVTNRFTTSKTPGQNIDSP
jgi:hypothetical protein